MFFFYNVYHFTIHLQFICNFRRSFAYVTFKWILTGKEWIIHDFYCSVFVNVQVVQTCVVHTLLFIGSLLLFGLMYFFFFLFSVLYCIELANNYLSNYYRLNFNCVPLSTVNIFCPCYFSSRPGTYSLQALPFYRFLHISQFVLLSGFPLNDISCQTNVMITLSINIIILLYHETICLLCIFCYLYYFCMWNVKSINSINSTQLNTLRMLTNCLRFGERYKSCKFEHFISSCYFLAKNRKDS